MASLCYPYGSGITCVCDEGRIYKCFPDLKSETGVAGGGQGPKPGSGVVLGANTQLSDMSPFADITGFDRSTEVVLASTFLILVILMFLAFIVHRCEKSFARNRDDPLVEHQHTCSKSSSKLSSTSVSIQTGMRLMVG